MIDVRIMSYDGKIEKTRYMNGDVTLEDIAIVLLELENAKLWLLEHAEKDFDSEMSIKDKE